MLDLKEERKYTRLSKLARELHIPMCEAFWTLEVFDKNGQLLHSHHQRSHSWVRNAYNLMFCTMACCPAKDNTFGAGLLSIKGTDAGVEFHVERQITPVDTLTDNISIAASHGILALATEINHGIIVGSGTNAESFEDYVLQTPIAEGAGGGQLNMAQQELHDRSYAGLVMKDELIRYFNNNSGGNVAINEVAIGVRGQVAGGSVNFFYSRDHLSSTVTIPDTGQLKVTYSIQLTYPS